MNTKMPDRDEYPEPSINDLKRAIEAAYNCDRWTHFVRGRYTAHRTYTEHEPDAKPGDKHVAIRVQECEREIIMDVVEDEAESVIALLESASRTEPDS